MSSEGIVPVAFPLHATWVELEAAIELFEPLWAAVDCAKVSQEGWGCISVSQVAQCSADQLG